MEKSKRHLLATNHPIKEIAFHLGFSDVSYFTRFFKKHTNLTPKEFRAFY
ncbi:helix-turn-helix domain-containing protein [Mariniphaga sediminis]